MHLGEYRYAPVPRVGGVCLLRTSMVFLKGALRILRRDDLCVKRY